MIQFSRKTLELLPSASLTGLSNTLVTKRAEYNKKLSSLLSRKSKLTGVYSITEPEGGRISVRTGADAATASDRKKSQISTTLGAANVITQIRGEDEPAFVPGSAPSHTNEDLDTLDSELKTFYSGEVLEEEEIDEDDSTSSELSDLELEIDEIKLNLESISTILSDINDIIQKREDGVLASPQLNFDALKGVDLGSRMKKRIDDLVRFTETSIVTPYIENVNRVALLRAQIEKDLDQTPLFDFEYGPPISVGGKFILSEDGIYYDSRIGGIYDRGVGEYLRQIYEIRNRRKGLDTGDLWKLEYAPNLGGKGIHYGKQEYEGLKDTIFSDNYDLSSKDLNLFYVNDDILQAFEDDKRAHIEEVNGQVSSLLNSGYSASDSVVVNTYNSIGAVAYAYDEKIRKRKKQLQLAALFGPYRISKGNEQFGEGNLYHIERDGSETPIERIPVNDFSFLSETGVSVPVEDQKNITLYSEDLEDVISPIEPKFLVTPSDAYPTNIPNFSVDILGKADWVKQAEGYQYSRDSFSSTTPYVKSLTDDIVTDGLLVCYNFLDKDISDPSSLNFSVNNVAESSTRLNAKLVAHNPMEVFVSGLGIPYLRGTLWDAREQYNQNFLPSRGSYIRLPNNIQSGAYNKNSTSLDNLFYSPQGATIEFWTHVPFVHRDMTEQHRYRLVLANENSGKTFAGSKNHYPVDATRVKYDNDGNAYSDPDKVHGLIVGFRDKGVSGTTRGSTNNFSGLEFIVCPTVGQNDSKWGHSICIAEDLNNNELGVIVPSSLDTAVRQKSIDDVQHEFLHFAITFDPAKDTVTIYCDGEKLTSSSITASFGTRFENLNIPSKVYYKQGIPSTNWWNSYYGDGQWSDPLALPAGSKVPPDPVLFTPWIIGGGFSDNISYSSDSILLSPAGFMGINTNDDYWNNGTYTGNHNSGQHVPGLGSFVSNGNSLIPRSGLDGHVGSFKMYNKALSPTEVSTNYIAQKGFFKKVMVESYQEGDVSGTMTDGYTMQAYVSVPTAKIPPGGWPMILSIPSTGSYRKDTFELASIQQLARGGYVVVSMDSRTVGTTNTEHSFNLVQNNKHYYKGDSYRVRDTLDIFETIDLGISSVSSIVEGAYVNTDKIGVIGISNGGIGSLLAAQLSGKPVSGLNPVINEAQAKLTASGLTDIDDWGYTDTDTFRSIAAVVSESAVSTELSSLALRGYTEDSLSGVTSLAFMRRIFTPNTVNLCSQFTEEIHPLISTHNYSGIANYFDASTTNNPITGPYPLSSVTVPTDCYLSWHDLQYSPYLALHRYFSGYPSTTPFRVHVSTGHHGSPDKYAIDTDLLVRQKNWFDKYLYGADTGVENTSKYKLYIIPNSASVQQSYFAEPVFLERNSYPVNSTTKTYFFSGNNSSSGTLESVSSVCAGSSVFTQTAAAEFSLSTYANNIATVGNTDTTIQGVNFTNTTSGYESAVLDKDLVCVGTPSASLYVSGDSGATASGMQVVAALYERTSTGDIYVGGGVVTTNTSGGVVDMVLRSVSYRFRQGNKILVYLSSIFLQQQVLDSGTSYNLTWEAVPYGHDFSFQVEHNSINPSYITLPII